MKEEIFGPILPIFTYTDLDIPIKYINQGAKPLAIYYYGSNTSSDIDRIIKETSSGAFVVNESAM